jgi:hypothetical protein
VTGEPPPSAPALDRGFPSAAWLALLRARGSLPTFADARAALDERVEGYHAVLPDIPNRQAGYYHEFFCPDHAVQLVFNPRDGHHHVCPVDGRVFSGEPFDSAWGWSVNDALSDAALRTAVRRSLGHAADRATVDAGLVRHVLLGYAKRYRTMPPAPQGHPDSYSGMVCWSALDESVWIIRLVWAAALARDALAAEELLLLREGLFQPAIRQLLEVRYQQIQNVGNWDRGAILNLGLLLGDDAVVQQALDEQYGIRDQLTRGVTADGLWWELSLSYHFYVLGAVSWTMRALRASGRTFDKEDVIRRMFAAPVDLAFPDLTLPATNDCWYHIGLLGEVGHGIPNADGFYEMAFGWFGDPAFAWVVGENRLAGKPRGTLEGLLDGAADLPIVQRPELRSRHFGGSGLAMPRAGSGHDAIAVLLKASNDDGDAHGHPDQLGVAIFAAGGRIAIDPGTPGYGIPLNDTWYRQTAAHSTVLLDSRSQPPGRARITRFESTPGRTAVEAEIEWPPPNRWPDVIKRARTVSWPDQDPYVGYAGVRMWRRLELQPGELVDTFTVEAPGERLIDLALHLPAGTRATDEAAVREAPDALVPGCGYEHLTHVVPLPEELTTLRASLPAGELRVEIPPDQAADDARLLASAPGNPAGERHAVLVRRRTAQSATFVTRLSWRSATVPWPSSPSSSG